MSGDWTTLVFSEAMQEFAEAHGATACRAWVELFLLLAMTALLRGAALVVGRSRAVANQASHE